MKGYNSIQGFTRAWVDSAKGLPLGIKTKILGPVLLAVGIIFILCTTNYCNLQGRLEKLDREKINTQLHNVINELDLEQRQLERENRVISHTLELQSSEIQGDADKLDRLLSVLLQAGKQERVALYDGSHQALVSVSNSLFLSNSPIRYITSDLVTPISEFRFDQKGLTLSTYSPIQFNSISDANNKAMTLLLERRISFKDILARAVENDLELMCLYNHQVAETSLKTDYTDQLAQEFDQLAPADSQVVNLNIQNHQLLATGTSIGNGRILVWAPAESGSGYNLVLLLSIFAISILMILLLRFIVTNLVTESLDNISETVSAIGAGDFTRVAVADTNDELGNLGGAVNLMAGRIKERIEKAEYLATIDGLTGLFNHRFFQQRLSVELKRAKRLCTSLSLIILDIDYFKQYNDSHGHPAGDKVLKEIAQVLVDNIRGNDLAARYGGEEFVIILVDTDAERAREIGERIRKVVENYQFAGREEQPGGRVTVSLGIATYPAHAHDKDQLIKMADDALYKAKYTSKNLVVLYHSVLDKMSEWLAEDSQDIVNTIKNFIHVINSKDKYTYGHSERVVKYALALGRVLQLSESELLQLEFAAYLHDIGKIKIPQKILLKTEPLTEDEQQLLQQHPIWGAELIYGIEALNSIAQVIMYHHEAYDGSGYPEGLKGTDIPYLARILHIVDSFDAMTTERPYQILKTIQEAKDDLIQLMGVQFDPEIVRAFLKILESQEELVQRLVS